MEVESEEKRKLKVEVETKSNEIKILRERLQAETANHHKLRASSSDLQLKLASSVKEKDYLQGKGENCS